MVREPDHQEVRRFAELYDPCAVTIRTPVPNDPTGPWYPVLNDVVRVYDAVIIHRFGTKTLLAYGWVQRVDERSGSFYIRFSPGGLLAMREAIVDGGN